MPFRNSPADRAASSATYGSPEYQANRRTVLQRARGRCEQCGQVRRLQCDHIVPVSQGGGHEVANLRAVCEPCHRAKTASEGGGYRNRPDPPPSPRTRW